jgi:hypothetical protein
MIADVHKAPAGGAVAIDDVQLPESEVGLLGPVMRHGADLRVDRDGLRVLLKDGKEDTRGTQRFLAGCFAVVFF